jgi:hypothetical protein
MLFLGSFPLLSQGPDLTAPLNQETCLDTVLIVFMWEEYPTADDYRIEVSTTADFSNVVIDANTNGDNFYEAATLRQDQTYYWRVYAIILNPPTEEVSETWSFTTLKNPPELVQPIDNNSCVDKTYEFKWKQITDASNFADVTYNFQLSRLPDFSTLIEDRTGLADTNLTITLPEYYQRYYWRVQAIYDGCTTLFSAADSFMTQREPATLESPANNTNSVSKAGVRFTWSSSVAPSSYTFQVSMDSTFSTVLYEYIGTNTTDSISNLLNNTFYYWRVRMDYDGCNTEWTQVWKFRTEYEKPQNLLPKDDSLCVPHVVRFRWDPVFDAVTYHVQISELMDFSELVLDSTGIDINFMNWVFPKAEQDYYWRVKAEDANNSGPWSDSHVLTTATTYPERTAPLDGTGDLPQTITFKWNKFNLNSYETIQVSDDSTFRSVLFERKNIQGDSIIFKMPGQFVTYYWRIMSEVDFCKSVWSPVWSFSTVLLPPEPTYPADDATNLSFSLTFEWKEAEGAKSYDFHLSKSPVFTELEIGRTGILGSKLYVSDLEPSTEYFWRLKSVNDNGESVWSDVFSFTTAAEALDPPVLESPFNGKDKLPVNKILLVWHPVDRATKYTIQVADNKLFVRPIIDQPGEKDTVYTLTSLSYGTTYYWRVMAENDELQSSWSTVWAFKTVVQVPTEAPQLIQPVDNLDPAPTEMTFKWTPVDRAENYELQIAFDEQFTNFFLKDTNIYNAKRFVSNIDFEEQFFWRVRAKNYSGKGPWSETRTFTTLVNSINDELAAKFNAVITPNPTNAVAYLSLTLADDANVQISIYDASGLKVKSLTNKVLPSGMHSFVIDAKHLSSGAYFALIRVNDRTFTLKFVVGK